VEENNKQIVPSQQNTVFLFFRASNRLITGSSREKMITGEIVKSSEFNPQNVLKRSVAINSKQSISRKIKK
jgi:hypothetical protein